MQGTQRERVMIRSYLRMLRPSRELFSYAFSQQVLVFVLLVFFVVNSILLLGLSVISVERDRTGNR